MSSSVALTILTTLVVCQVVWSLPKEDAITNLPGLSYTPNFRQFSGYLDALGGNKLHYWFVESQRNPTKAPVVVWFNGGPGCSSLFGLLGENGPFHITTNGSSLYENQYSWNKLANVLYLEAPAGVGFSYSESREYSTNDNQTARNNFAALTDFFKKFPEYQSNDFYLSGESYAGFYIPTLVSLMIDTPTFNLKGFLIGNSLSSFPLNENSRLYFLYNHGLVSHTLWEKLLTTCGCKNNVDACDFFKAKDLSAACKNNQDIALTGLANLDPYNIYSNVGYSSGQTCDTFLNLRRQMSNVNRLTTQLDVETCNLYGGVLSVYLNNPKVRQALHIPEFVQPWVQCSGLQYSIQYTDMFAEYKKAIGTKKLRILLFNGDVDSVCNFLGDEWFVDALPLNKPYEKYTQWFYHTSDGYRQVGGFYTRYDRFTFATVRGSGHMVPQDKPAAAYILFENYLNNVF